MFELPEGKTDAWSIKANSVGNKIYVEIKNNLEEFDTCLFLLSVRGYLYVYKLIPAESQASFSIPTDELPAGIAVLTLLNKQMLPQAERLIFVKWENFVSSTLSTENKVYLPRDSVSLHIDLSNKIFDYGNGQYSVSVFDAVFGSAVLIDEPNIISSSYLSPEIRSVVHNPNYYFNSDSGLTAYHLDLLLMTQGWRAYNYLEKMTGIDSVKIPENQDVVKGNIKKIMFANRYVPTEGNILIYFAGNSKTISTDSLGNFSFFPEYTKDHTSSILLAGKDKKGSDEVFLSLYDAEFQNSMEEYLHGSFDSTNRIFYSPTYVYEDITRKLHVNTRNSIWIDEVEIRAKKYQGYQDVDIGLITSFTNTKTSSQSMLESNFEIEDIIMSMGFYGNERDGKLFVYFRGSEIAARFVVDGINEGDDISFIRTMYQTTDLKNLYVVTGREALLAYGSTFVIYLQIDRDSYKERQVDNTPNSRVIKQVKMTKVFYRPTYRTEEEREFPVPDIRKTIHWDPNIKLNSDGIADVSFYNSDRLTKVKCILEGITDSGIPVYAEAYYNISIYREKR